MSNHDKVVDFVFSVSEKVPEDVIEALEDLGSSEKWEGALQAAGVDNWSGYEYAQELMDE